ncbi:MAG: InlB B-repeat-containing protein, partial [Planctomycetota bacterium]
MEFIVLAVLAVVGSAAIVLFVVRPAAAPPTAQADDVVAQQDTPKPIADAETDEKPEQLAVKVDDGQAGSDTVAASADVKPMVDGSVSKTHSLSVTAVGGSVTSSPAQAGYNQGDTVTLEAVPNAGYSFTNWSGDLSGSDNPATLVMEADKSVTAGFAPKTYSLTANATGGSVKRSPDQASYNHGERVTLRAVPDTGYRFSNWAGDLAGSTNPATLIMDADRAVSAGFAVQSYSLTVTATDGSVTRSPDQPSYNHGETVTLEAVPNAGYGFTNWSGDLAGSTNPVTVVMEADKTVIAGFSPDGHRLTVTAVGGSVKRTPAKASYQSGDTVTLEAVSNAGYSFTSWSGDLSGAANPATL